jgi:hypothetical protein
VFFVRAAHEPPSSPKRTLVLSSRWITFGLPTIFGGLELLPVTTPARR